MPDLTDPKLQKAIRHVEELLSHAPGGPNPQGVPAREVIDAGEAVGLTRWQLRTARDVLKVTSEKETDVKHGRWFWRLPPNHVVPIHLPELPTTSPAGSHSASYKLTTTTESVSQPAPSMTNRTQGAVGAGYGSDDAIRAWAQRKGYPISKFGPIPQWAIEAYERDSAKPVSIMREVRYQSYCPKCDRPTVVLTRTVEFRETSDGDFYGVNDTGTRSMLCEKCQAARIAEQKARVDKQIAVLESERRRIAAADPNDGEVLSCEQRIQTLRAELQRFEELVSNA